jgi:hypothetical protein
MGEPEPEPEPGTLVSDTPALQAALKAWKEGDPDIILAPGDYSYWNLKPGITFPGAGPTVRAQDPNNRPVFDGIYISDWENIAIYDVESWPVGSPLSAITITAATNIILGFSRFRGKDDTIATDSQGVLVRNSQGVLIHNVEATGVNYGIVFMDGDHVEIRDCIVHHCQCDGIRGGGANDLTIEGNVVHSLRPVEGEHPDAIQVWTTNVYRITERVTVRNNLYYPGDNAGTMTAQGVFFRDQISAGYRDITITGNAVIGGIYQGVCMPGTPEFMAEDVTVCDNFVQGWVGQRSWVRVDCCASGTWADNVSSYFNIGETGNGPDMIDGGGNVTITEDAPAGDYTEFNKWSASHPDTPRPPDA